jgi:hypothetical protein
MIKKLIISIYNAVGKVKLQYAIALLTLALFPPFCWGGLPEEQPSSRAAAMAYSAVGLTDGWSVFFNQASLGLQESPWIGVHHENRFITPELSFSALGVLLPVKTGTLGLTLKRLGFSQFNQTKVGLAYGMQLAPTLSVGIQLNMHHVFIAGEYGSANVFTAEGGILYNPTPNLSIGLHIMNPTRTEIQKDERIPTIFNLGIAYQLGEMVMVTSGVEKNIDTKSSFKAGIEFIPIKKLTFRIGLASNPSLVSFGLGYQISNIQMDLAFSRHEHLGYTPHFSLAYQFGQRKKTPPIEPATL